MKDNLYRMAAAICALVLTSAVFTACDTPVWSPIAGNITVSGTISANTPAGPLEGATVTLKQGATEKGSATTDANGSYTISNVVKGTYTIEVSKSGYITGTIPGFTVSENVSGKNLQLVAATYTVSGTITANLPAAGTPLSGATVTLKDGTTTKGSATTATNGTYTISNVVNGTYTIEVSKSGYRAGTIASFTVSGANVSEKNLQLIDNNTPVYTVSGTISADIPSGPLSGAIVKLKDNATEIGNATTAIDGTYTISNVIDGTYTIEVSKSGYNTGTIASFTVSGANVSGKNLQLIAGSYTISGTITGDNPAGALAGATVTLKEGGTSKGSATTATNGTYTISNVAYGTYTIEVSKSGYITGTIPSFTVSGNVSDKDLKLLIDSSAPILVPGANLNAKFQWLKTNASSFTDYTVEVNAHEDLTAKTLDAANLNGRGTVKITLVGIGAERIVQLSGGGPLFTIKNGITLVLGNNIHLTQGGGSGGALVDVDTGGKFFMEDGSSVTNVTNTGIWGGAVRVWGTFTMNGGTISDNTATDGGVAVYEGTFTMNGGTIYNNSKRGVHVSRSGGTFTMTGGTISGNKEGGVDVGSESSFTMSGGTISGNQAGDGGGVYAGGTFTMSGGVISGNTASMGGGVFVGSYGNLNKTAAGGIIYGNDDATNKNTATGGTTGKAGHAIYIYGGSYNDGWRNSTVTANEAITAVNGDSGTGTWGD